MGDRIPWDVIPDQRGVLATGLYTFELDAVERQTSRNGTLMYKETKHVAEGQFRGHVAYEYHNIGNAKDPLAQDPVTWRDAIGARTLKGLFKVLDVPFSDNIEGMAAQAQGRRFMQDVTEKVEPEQVLNKQTGAMTPNTWTTPEGKVVSRGGMRSNDFGRRYRAAAPTTAPNSSVDGGEEMITSPFTGTLVPQSQYAAHITEHLNKGR